MKIYAVQHSKGLYADDYREWIEKAFIDKFEAESIMLIYNSELEERQQRQLKEQDEFVGTCPEENDCNNCELDNCLNFYDFDYNLDEEHPCKIVEIELVE